MASRSERLQPVKKVAENREQNAAKEMGKARTRMEELEARLSELISFREEYTRNFLVAGTAGMGVGRMREYQTFITRLDQAITYQRNVVEQAKRTYADRQRVWGHFHGRVLAMDKLATRYRQQERTDADQREQKETDERAQRSARIEL
ncbi:flagellar FliJ protein [Gammaproteobacteria bacterium]